MQKKVQTKPENLEEGRYFCRIWRRDMLVSDNHVCCASISERVCTRINPKGICTVLTRALKSYAQHHAQSLPSSTEKAERAERTFPHEDPSSPGYSPYKRGGDNPDPRKKY